MGTRLTHIGHQTPKMRVDDVASIICRAILHGATPGLTPSLSQDMTPGAAGASGGGEGTDGDGKASALWTALGRGGIETLHSNDVESPPPLVSMSISPGTYVSQEGHSEQALD